MKTPKQKYILHCHHNILLELLRGTLGERIAYIKKEKPENEQETRLRLIRVLTDEEVEAMPQEAWDKAREAREARDKAREAWEARDKAREAWDKAREARDKAYRSPAMRDWHKKVCVPDCPWDWEKGKIDFEKNV